MNTPTLPLIVGFQRLSDQTRGAVREIERGRGVFIYDTEGREYLEASASFYVASLGYDQPELVAAAAEQMGRLPYYTSALNRTPRVSLELAEKLLKLVPVANAHMLFATTGSEANDFLAKLLLFQSVVQGHKQRTKFIARTGSYHGGTLASASLTGGHHEEFGLPLPGFLHVSQPDYHGLRRPGETPREFTHRLAAELDALLAAEGPDSVAAFFAEPVSFSAGMITPPDDYFAEIAAVLDRHAVALVADEVITGFGRTGAMFGCDTYRIEPDHVTMAKGITSGYFPVAAIAIGPELYADVSLGADEVGVLAHAATSAAHPVGAAVALKTIEIIERDGLAAHAGRMGAYLRSRLSRFEAHPWVGTLRHVGLACAIDFLRRDADDAIIEDDATARCRSVYERALGQGLIVRPAGRSIVIAPPLIVTESEIDELVRRLERAMDHGSGPIPPPARSV